MDMNGEGAVGWASVQGGAECVPIALSPTAAGGNISLAGSLVGKRGWNWYSQSCTGVLKEFGG